MIYAFGAYTLDLRLYELRRAGHIINLEPQVFKMFAYLVQPHDRVVSSCRCACMVASVSPFC